MVFLKDPLILKVKDVLLRGIGAEIIRYMWTVSEATAPQIISHIQLELKDDDVRSDSELIMKYIISFITNNIKWFIKKYLDYANFLYFFKSKVKEFPNLF